MTGYTARSTLRVASGPPPAPPEWLANGDLIPASDPYVTWYPANRAVDEAVREGSAGTRYLGEVTMGEDEPWYAKQVEAIRAHAIREKEPDGESK